MCELHIWWWGGGEGGEVGGGDVWTTWDKTNTPFSITVILLDLDFRFVVRIIGDSHEDNEDQSWWDHCQTAATATGSNEYDFTPLAHCL